MQSLQEPSHRLALLPPSMLSLRLNRPLLYQADSDSFVHEGLCESTPIAAHICLPRSSGKTGLSSPNSASHLSTAKDAACSEVIFTSVSSSTYARCEVRFGWQSHLSHTNTFLPGFDMDVDSLTILSLVEHMYSPLDVLTAVGLLISFLRVSTYTTRIYGYSFGCDAVHCDFLVSVRTAWTV